MSEPTPAPEAHVKAETQFYITGGTLSRDAIPSVLLLKRGCFQQPLSDIEEDLTMLDSSVSSELQRMLQPDLETGEQLLWAGQPNPTRAALPYLPISLFALLWTGAVAYMSQTFSFSGPPRFMFLAIFALFFLVGLALMAFPLFWYFRAKQGCYAVTNKRLLLVQAGKSRNLQSYTQDDIEELECTERADKSGDLIFAQRRWKDSDGDWRTQRIGFLGIPQVRSVERLVRDVFKK
jgi:hypothetical protein